MFLWGLFLSIAAALVVGGYFYFRLDDEIRRQVEQRLANHYQHLTVHVGGARFEQDRGITIHDLSFFDPHSSTASQPLVAVDELFLAGNIRVEELLSGKLQIDRIVVRRPRLNAQRQADGKWNVATLMPLPKFSDQSPPIVIEDATVTLADASRGAATPLVLRGIAARLTPAAATSAESARRYHVAGAATGLPTGELRFDGEVGASDGAVHVAVRAGGLELSPELLASIPAPLTESLQGVQLSGRADIVLRIVRAAGAAADIEWSADVKMTRGRLQHARLPQPLTDLTLNMQADRQHLSIEALTARCGTADVALACQRSGWSTDAPLGLAVRLTGFTIDSQMRAALPERFAPWWDRFQPEGKVDAEFGLTFDGRQWRPQVTIDCRGVSLTDAERFPYRIQQAVGRIEYVPAGQVEADKLAIDLTGVGGGRPVQIKAELTQLMADRLASSRRSKRPLGWIEITGTDIPVHKPLLKALAHHSPRGGQFVDSLSPQGAFDFLWRAEWRDPFQAKADTALNLTLKDCNIQFDRFAYPLRHVRGLVTERNRHWVIHDVEGRGGNDSTVVVCRGEATPTAAGHQMNLVFQAANVPLDDTLKQALSAGAQQAWDDLRPQGRVDFTAHVVHETGQLKSTFDVQVTPHDKSVSIEPRRFPYRFEELEGSARFTEGRVDLSDVSARHGRTTFIVKSGTWQAAPQGGWQFVMNGVNADRLTPQRDLLIAVPPALRSVIERLQPSGTFGLYNGTLSFAQRGDDPRIASAWDVNLDCHQVTLAGGIPLANITGSVRLAGRADGQATFTAGELDLDSLSWKGMQLTAVRGPLWADSSVCLLGQPAAARQGGAVVQPVTADAYGGSLTMDARLEHAVSQNYRIELALGGADLARFARERLGGPKQLSGAVSGRLTLQGTGSSTPMLRGVGDLHVVDANIYELPVIVAMLKVLRNRSPNATAFNRCDMQFGIQGEDVVFSQLNLLGDAVSLYGEGKTDFDRRLNLVFYSLAGPADLPIPFYKTILGQASQQILQVKVSGTWDVPEPELKALPAVNDAWKRIQAELEAGAATVTSPAAMRDAIAPRR